MTETTRSRKGPDGRFVTFADLIGTALGALALCVVVLLVFEGVLSLLRVSEFGSSSGWLALVLPAWLFVEEFRSAGWGAYRIVVALLGIGFGVAVGMTVAGLAAGPFPSLVSGAIGALSLTVVYCAVWFYGLRWLSHRAG